MPTLIIGIAALLLVLWAANAFAKSDPRTLIRVGKTAGGAGALLVAGALAITGRFAAAVPFGMAGLALLGVRAGSGWFGGQSTKTAGQVSRVRSAFIEMELDHDTGAMRGRILAGRYEGTSLDALEATTLTALLGEIDEESRALLAAYLDRRQPGWRENTHYDTAAGRGGASSSGPMTPEEAYQILGLEPGADAADISRAHRLLMKKLHPDQGG
ncbi:MAG TPA: DnaJ domain-containing protein, partial [Xanthobacteraceae bacterium]|nr:DnaJ domain-containing protein [Xanthobacteraceae bacterium]